MSDAPFFAVVKNAHPALTAYVHTPVVQSASFSEQDDRYHYTKHGQRIACGGLVQTLKYRFYAHYKDNRSKRRTGTRSRGSNKAQGKLVDSQLLHYVHVGKRPKRCTKMTQALLNYWSEHGHTLEAAQLPVELVQWNKMTQADVITRKNNQLYMWEVKTGFPIGGFRKQAVFAAPLQRVPCTKYNIWQLQMHYTMQGLRQQGLPIKQGCVIQVYSKDKQMQVKVHKEADWLSNAPSIAGQTVVTSTKKTHTPVVL
jgi:hypothetical protein